MKYLFLIATCIFFNTIVFAQPPIGMNRSGAGRGTYGNASGHFYGKIVDSKTNKGLDGATVVLYGNKFDTATKKLKQIIIKTLITETNGDFNLDGLAIMGNYKLKVTSIGYKPFEKALKFEVKMGGQDGAPDMQKIMGMTDVDLGNLKLEMDANNLANVTVTSSKQLFELGIDRKIFNVDKNLVSTGQTATEIMKTIPSLSVDIDGNVQLRNATPQLFIDGRPTTLTLDQIPADIIDKVEIITNPSAKYDASGGNAGILNIVLKKNKKNGYNGGVRAGIDSRAKINFGSDINFRQNKINFFASANYNERKSIVTSAANSSFLDYLKTKVVSDQTNTSNGYFAFFRGGLDYFVDNRNTITLNGNMYQGKFENNGDQWLDSSALAFISLTDRNTIATSNFKNVGAQLSYKHNFTKNGHSISGDLNYNSSENDNINFINSIIKNSAGVQKYPIAQQKSVGNGNNKFLTIQTDYENQISDNTKIEAGLRGALRDFGSTIFQYVNANGIADNYLLSARASSNYIFNDQVFAAYTTYNLKQKKWSYLIGLRIESSNYTGNLLKMSGADSATFKIKYPLSLFPSAFITYKLTDQQDLQLNYSRRINRPNFFQLLPAYDFSDPQNPNVGNPNLNPEFTHSLEFSYNNNYSKNANFLATAYYKYSTNLITRYVYKDVNKNMQPGQTLNDSLFYTSYINANNSYNYGIELTNKMPVTKWWDLTLNLNLFYTQLNANIPNQNISNNIASWFAKMNSSIKLTKTISFQISAEARSKILLAQTGGQRGGGMYWGNSLQTLAQGYILPRYFDVDIALKKDWTWKNGKSGSLTLSMNDLFRTLTKTYTEAIFFVQETSRRRDPQVVRLNFNYRFGKFDMTLFKRKNTKAEQGGMDMGGMNN